LTDLTAVKAFIPSLLFFGGGSAGRQCKAAISVPACRYGAGGICVGLHIGTLSDGILTLKNKMNKFCLINGK
jgi:hypothetical protein